jgi:chromate reductase
MGDEKILVTERRFKVVGIAGSLRAGSLNGRLLDAAAELCRGAIDITVYRELSAVPLFNEDLETGPLRGPESISRLRQAVAGADGVLIATPEYNQSMPGVVKNMVDWLSRADPEVLAEKPMALFGATPGAWGTRLAQAALRQTLTACGAIVMPSPQLYLRNAADLLGNDGRFADERAKENLVAFVEAFANWIHISQALGRRDAVA